MIAVPPLRAAILTPKAWPYVLLARFGADKAAPLPSPLVGDVGTLTVTDATGILSQSGGVLVANGTAAANSGVNTAAQLARVAGRALLLQVPTRTTTGGGGLGFGFDPSPATAASFDHGFDYTNATGGRVKVPGSNVLTFATAAGRNDWALVLRSTGAFFLSRDGGTGPFTLRWVGAALTGAEYAKVFVAPALAIAATVDDFRVVDLGGAWASDYGIATSRLAGSRAAGDRVTHTPDFLLEFTVTTLPSAGSIQVAFRQQDTSNEWYLDISSTGAIVLNEFVAAGATSRGSSTGVANGNRVVVVADGTSIKVYVADVSKITYSSASNFATAATAQVVALGTGGAVSDLIAWPRVISLPSGV